MAKMLTEGSPARLIWGFTLPLLAGNIFQQMYAFVDTLVVGRFLGVEALAAVGCTGGLMFLLMGFVIGTATGLSLYTGQRYGARDMAGVRKSAAACFLLAMLIGMTVAGISVLAARSILLFMQTPPEILENAVTFIQIIGANAPFLMLFSMQANLIRALGDSRTPAWLLALGLTLNILFEPFFILVLDLGVPGAALATAASQVAASRPMSSGHGGRIGSFRRGSSGSICGWGFPWGFRGRSSPWGPLFCRCRSISSAPWRWRPILRRRRWTPSASCP